MTTKRFKRLQTALTDVRVDPSVWHEIEKMVVYHSDEFKDGKLPVAMFYSGTTMIRMSPELHAAAAAKAKKATISLNNVSFA